MLSSVRGERNVLDYVCGEQFVRLSQFSISQMIRIEREKFKWWIVIIV